MEKLWYLKNVNLFKGLSQDEMMMIDKKSIMQQYSKGETIYSADSKGDYIYILKEGKVRLHTFAESGHELTFALLKQGEIFGVLTPNTNQDEFAEAFTKSYICKMEKKNFLKFIQSNSDLVVKWNSFLNLKIKELKIFISDLAFKSINQRLSALLIKLYEQFGVQQKGVKNIELKLTHYHLATMIGATREATSNGILRLKKQNIIDCQRKKIIIKDYDKLKSVSSMFEK